jgi:hypothetical protein
MSSLCLKRRLADCCVTVSVMLVLILSSDSEFDKHCLSLITLSLHHPDNLNINDRKAKAFSSCAVATTATMVCGVAAEEVAARDAQDYSGLRDCWDSAGSPGTPFFKHDGSIVEIAAAESKVRLADDTPGTHRKNEPEWPFTAGLPIQRQMHYWNPLSIRDSPRNM